MTGLEDLARAALAEASRWPARTPGRRAAAHLWIACTVPAAASLDAAMRAVRTFGDADVQTAAADLLRRIAAEIAGANQDVPAATASGAAPTEGTPA